MPPFWHQLSTKIVVRVLAAIALLAAATLYLIVQGFQQAQEAAVERSIAGLRSQAHTSLHALTVSKAELIAAQLNPATLTVETAARAMVELSRQDGQQPWDRSHLAPGRGGAYFDTNPSRASDVWANATIRFDADTERDLQNSARLHAVLPALMGQYHRAVAIYYISPQGFIRYYPVVNLSERVAKVTDILGDPNYLSITPANNPDRKTTWSSAYLDNVGAGLMVTAFAPVYDGDDFRGGIGVDVSLSQIVLQLEQVEPTPGGYAFLVDGNGHLVAAPPKAEADLLGISLEAQTTRPGQFLNQDLTAVADEDLRQVIDAMRGGEAGLREMVTNDGIMLLAYAPLTGIGWSLALAAPLEEVTVQSKGVAAVIRADAERTLERTLMAAVVVFMLALIGATLFTRRLITEPMGSLVCGARAIGAGNLDVAIPVTTQDEVGILAAAFNHMAAEVKQRNEELARSEQHLEQRVAEQTRELKTLLELTQNLTLTLDLESLLGSILDQLKRVVDYHGATILVREGEELVPRAYRGPSPADKILRARYPIQDPSSQMILNHGRPLVVADMQNDHLFKEKSAKAARELFETVLSYIRGWLAVPLIYQDEAIGVLILHHLEAGAFTEAHVEKVSGFAHQAAVAVENARLYRQARELAALQERQKLARELHDSVSQALYGIAMGAQTARKMLAQDPARLEEPLDYVLTLAEAGLTEMRALIFELRPESLAQEGLAVALEKQAAAVRARHQLDVQELIAGEPEVCLEVKEAFYRIAQEGLHNVVKHARAKRVSLRLAQCNGDVVLEIGDDGRGFDAGSTFPGHLGLQSMRERMERLGGTLMVKSAPGQGTRIAALFLGSPAGSLGAISVASPGP